MTARNIVFISDAHVACGGPNEAEFKAMLNSLAASDYDIFFLGDIMDLWIGKKRYEDDLQRWFVDWCRRESEHRRIVYVEGNHEFFVADKYNGVIGTFLEKRFHDDVVAVEHGHNILGRTIGFNRLFIAFCKSGFSSFVLDVVPFGQKLVLWIKGMFGSNGRTLFDRLPDEILRTWAENVSVETGCKDVFIGHFHTRQELELSHGGSFRIIPAWKHNFEVMLYEPDSRNATIRNWREIGK